MDPPDGDLFQIRLKYIEQLSYAMIIFAIILLQTLFYINMTNLDWESGRPYCSSSPLVTLPSPRGLFSFSRAR